MRIIQPEPPASDYYSEDSQIILPRHDPRMKCKYGVYAARIAAEVEAGADVEDDPEPPPEPDRFGWEQFARPHGRFYCGSCKKNLMTWNWFVRHLTNQHDIDFERGVPPEFVATVGGDHRDLDDVPETAAASQ